MPQRRPGGGGGGVRRMTVRAAIAACTSTSSSTTRGIADIDPVGRDGGGGNGNGRKRRQHTHTDTPTRQPQHRRRRRRHRHRGGPASPPKSAATLLASVLLALSTLPRAAAVAAAPPSRHRQLQTTPACPVPLANDGVYSVSAPADAVDLATALSACTGGAYNVTWTGAVVLDSPLVVAAGSSLTITGAQAAAAAAALDGGGVVGLVDLGAGSSLRLEGVTLRNGRRGSGNGGAVRAEGEGCSVFAVDSAFEGNEAASTASFEEGRGGALSLAGGATAELENCRLSGNSAENAGGGVWSQGDGGSVVLTGCVLEDNTSGWWGGAVGLEGRSTVVLDGSTVSGNWAVDEGGGLYGLNATVAVVGGSEFVNNTVGWVGGGISLRAESNLNVSDSFFRRNWWAPGNTSNPFGSGGGILVSGESLQAEVSIADSLFEENFAFEGGALWVGSGYSLAVTGTLFQNNSAYVFGGGYGGAASLTSGGVAEISACNFTGNVAFNGPGALKAEGSRVSITDSLFEGNNDRFAAGALSAEDDAVVTMERSTFVNNFLGIDGMGPGSGGAALVARSTLNATDCVFENNQAEFSGEDYDISAVELQGGGAVMLEDSANATFLGCNFTLNGGALGGAILAEGGSTAVLIGVRVASNEATVFGGGLSFNDGSSCLVTDSYVGGNTAGGGGGGLHFAGAIGVLDGVVLTGNSVSAGSGGALYFSSASNATVAGGLFDSNTASGSGGHVLATNPGTNVELLSSLPSSSSSSGATDNAVAAEDQEGGGEEGQEVATAAAAAPPLVLRDGEAGANGGAVHASDGAAVTASLVELSGNTAGGDGGAVSALGARLVAAEACNVTANRCGGNGGGVSVVGTEFVGTRSNFTGNAAGADGGGLRASTGGVVELAGCRVDGNTAVLGGGVSSVDATVTARNCQFTGNAASEDGGGLRISYQTIAALDACEVSFNTAGFDGGGVAVDAAAGTTDTTLLSSNASSTLVCGGGGSFEGNGAGERGGAVYVTRESTVTFDACGSLRNSASLGAAVYAAHSFVALTGGSVLAYDEVPTGAMIYALRTELEAHNATFWAADSPSMLAVQMADGSSMKAQACSFRGWEGPYVVLTGGQLEMDACDFRGSLADILVSSTNASAPARIRNTAVGIESYASLASSDSDTSLSRNVMTCASDPCGGGTAAAAGGQEDFGCIDGNLGVYCPCLVATVTGEEECLGELTTLQLESPTEQLVAVGTQGTIESTLNITAGTEGGAVVWKVEEMVRSFTEEGLVWTIVPNVGILEPGALATVSITGTLNATITGPTSAQFKVESMQSGKFALAMVNTTFYYCEEGEYYHSNGGDGSTTDDTTTTDDGDSLCLRCSDLNLGDEGLECDNPGVLLTTLPLASGYWRASTTATTIRECLNEDACEGGSEIQRSDDYCAVGYRGPYCAVCSSGFAGGISNGCHECSEAFRAGMYFLASVGAALFLIFFWILFRYLVQPPSGTRSFNMCRSNRIVSKARQLPLYKLKIPIVVFQILTQYADITSVDFPPTFRKFLSALDAVNLDVGWVLSASCIFAPNFYGRLLLTTLAPVVLGLALACTFVFARRRVMRAGLPKANDVSGMRGVSGRTGGSGSGAGMSESRQMSVVKTRHMAVLVVGTFLVYSTVSTIVFQTFACDTLEELDTSYLRADYSLVCNTHEHNMYKIYASVMILVYPIGIPLLYAWELFKHRHRIYPKQALRDGVSPERRLGDKKIAHTVVLWEAYRPSRYYYEVIECGRRLLLTGCLVFILPNSAGQAGVACVLAVAMVCLFITLKPFSDPNDDRLYILGCILIFLSMFVSLVPRVEIADGDDQSQTVVSWLLIILGVVLWLMAIVQCFWEVRTITRDAGGRSDSADTSSAAGLMGPDGFSRRSSGGGEEKSDGTNSGYKDFSPEDRNTDNPSSSDLYEFAHGNSGGSSGFGVGGGGGDRNSNGGVKGGAIHGSTGSRAEYHSNVAAAAGQLQMRSNSPAGSTVRGASGYADPVVLQFNNGLNGGGGDNGGGGGGGGNAAAAQAAAASNHSHSSGNTYGPLTSVEDGGGGGAADGRNTYNNADRFPPINFADDGVMDSPTMAEEMFSRRLGGGSGGTGGSGGGGGGGGGSSRSKGDHQPGAAGGSTLAGSATMYSGIDEHGGEEGGGNGPLRLSPAEPLANDAFPAPMTNAFPASTDTPDSEYPGRGGGGSGGGGGGRGVKQAGSSGPLSPSPASSAALLGPSPAASEIREDAAPGPAGRGTGGTFGTMGVGNKWGRLGSGGGAGSGSNR